MRASSLPVTALLLAGLLLKVAPAHAAEEADLLAEGARLARQTCAACHALEPGAKPGSAAAPSFPAIAAMASATSASLKVFLKTPHAAMPNIMLTEREIDALALYILSLRTN
ncbi:MAG: hypothetical protein JWN93_443 [Hyphomicrobiales bacterium]|nr:hypothetical protein [Hyphomicrobiales bacterium]